MLELADIQEAADRIRGQVVKTPCVISRTLSEMTGAELWLKFENLQFTASFKDRGAGNKLSLLTPDERKRGLVAMSAGNHAQGVAYHAQRLGVRAVIVMPRFTPGIKIANTRALGAEIALFGDSLEAARTHADQLAKEQGLLLVHPYDDLAIMAGQGTIGLEMLEAQPDLDVLVVPIGGGGLIAGIATAAKAIKPDIEVVGVEVRRFPSMYNLLRNAHEPRGTSTIAEGIAVSAPGTLCSEIIRQRVDDLLLVDEADVEQGIVLLLEVEKTVVEGAGAAALAAILRNRERFAGKKVGIVLSGGNLDSQLLAQIIDRGLVRSGRMARIVVSTRDVPGSLARITAVVAEAGANVDEVHHQRAFTLLAAQNVEIELVLQTRDHEHASEVIQKLEAEGMKVRVAGGQG